MTEPPDEFPEGRRIVLDPEAESADPSLPAFVARPAGAPVYHGFRVVEDVEFDGFKLGAITEFGPGVTEGDAFLIAPDGSRAGLVWEVGEGDALREVIPFEPDRWGVWGVSLPYEVVDVKSARSALRYLVGLLRGQWEDWRLLSEPQ